VLEPIGDTSTPAVAAIDGDVLIAYARQDPAVTCGSGEVAPVLGSRVEDAGSAGVLERDDAALPLGQTRDPSSPAVLAVPSFEEGQDALGWLVAFANADDAVELRQVGLDGVVSDPLLTLTSSEGYGDVSLVLAPIEGDQRLVGLAAQRGCGAQARIAFSVLRLTADGGELALERTAGDLLVGGAANESRPSVAYSERRGAFLVAYRDPSGLRARVLDAEGAGLGEQPYTLLRNTDSGTRPLRLTSSPLAVPIGTSGGWFGALVAAQSGEDRALQSVTLSSCP
jgi:hypothetical protein